jgi:hypothetical protein
MFFFFFFSSSPFLYFCHHIRSRLHFISSYSSSSFGLCLLLDHNKTRPNQTKHKKRKEQTFSTNKLQERKPWVQASCDFGNNKREER